MRMWSISFFVIPVLTRHCNLSTGVHPSALPSTDLSNIHLVWLPGCLFLFSSWTHCCILSIFPFLRCLVSASLFSLGCLSASLNRPLEWQDYNSVFKCILEHYFKSSQLLSVFQLWSLGFLHLVFTPTGAVELLVCSSSNWHQLNLQKPICWKQEKLIKKCLTHHSLDCNSQHLGILNDKFSMANQLQLMHSIGMMLSKTV